MVQDVLTLAQGFVDVALHPQVKEAAHDYLGDTFELVEAKGWKSLPTKRDFHGWHGDSWFNKDRGKERIPQELKLAFFSHRCGVSGGFQYIKGSQGQVVPRQYKKDRTSKTCPWIASWRSPAPQVRPSCLTRPASIGRPFPFSNRGRRFSSLITIPAFPCNRKTSTIATTRCCSMQHSWETDHGGSAHPGFWQQDQLCARIPAAAQHRGFQALTRWSYTTKLYASDYLGRFTGKVKKLVRR